VVWRPSSHAFRFAATELQRRHRPRRHSPAAPTAPPELRRAVELAPMRCPIQPRRRCPPLRWNDRREQYRARRPSSRRPNGQDRRSSHTRQDGAQAELAHDADARTATVGQEQQAPRCSLPMRGAARHRVDRRYRFTLGASASGQPSRRSQGTNTSSGRRATWAEAPPLLRQAGVSTSAELTPALDDLRGRPTTRSALRFADEASAS
jgi:hypothetical protein